MSLIPPPNEVGDIFSLSDQQLSERYQFVEEIGFGNWGSVWLCRPKDADGHPIDDAAHQTGKVAVKLVHRSKTPTTAARVRSLWNEMKIVRSFKNDPHPSIIPFHNFIITPSYALITMAYLPTLVPVEVPELRAKPWFLSLISAVAFLHARGVVHNDIKPANILLTQSSSPVPVLVDFGFAEKYDPRSSKAFLSNLAYGTPEYLSPERARGLPHDTRKSDVWSLGVTLFEVLRGRTPFEYAEPDGTTETFSTKADLEKYWARTVKGKWVGKYSMSKGLERLLRKMILPNADLRITAPVALNDPYFDPDKPPTPGKERSRSTLTFRSTSEAEASRLVEVNHRSDQSGAPTGLSPPASLLKYVATATARRPNIARDKENLHNGMNAHVSPGKEKVDMHTRRESIHSHQRTHSAKVVLSQEKLPAIMQPFKNAARKAPSFNSTTTNQLSPISGTVSSQPTKTLNAGVTPQYKQPITADTSNRNSILTASSFASKENSAANSRTTSGRRMPVRKPMPAVFAAAHKGKQVGNGVDNGAVHEATRDNKENRKSRVLVDLTKQKMNSALIPDENGTTPVAQGGTGPGLLTPVAEDPPRFSAGSTFPRSTKESTGMSALKEGIKQSLDKGIRLYKSSALGSYGNVLGNKSTTGLSSVAPELSRSAEADSERSAEKTKDSWESDVVSRMAKSSLPTVHHAIRNKQVAEDNRLDRMTIWIRNVERVVEDARANFAAGSMTPLPPLPPRTAQANRRGPPKVKEMLEDNNAAGSNGVGDTPLMRQRRVTLVSQSPQTHDKERNEYSSDSPAPITETTRKGIAQDVHNFARPITPLATVELELASGTHLPLRSPTRLSAVLDPNAFFAPPTPIEDEPSANEIPLVATERLGGHSIHTPSGQSSPVNGADYEEILMSSSAVKRVGKGYESKITTSHIVEHSVPAFKRNPKLFHSVRRGVAPSPETPRKAVSVHELGALSAAQESAARKEDGNHTVKLMRRAFRAITGGTVSRRLSKAV